MKQRTFGRTGLQISVLTFGCGAVGGLMTKGSAADQERAFARALAVSSGKRIAAAPEIPTIAEQGFPGFDVNPWWGILAPAGIDMGIVRKINADVEAILRTKEMVDFLAAQGADPLIMSPEDFLKILQADIVKWDKVVKAAGVTLN